MALMKLFIEPIIKESKNKNFVILNFYINDDLKPNLNDENLLQNLKPIFYFNSKSIIPTESYKNAIRQVIKSNYPTTKKEIIKKLANSNNKYFLRRNWYQKFTLLKIRIEFLVFLVLTNIPILNHIPYIPPLKNL